MPVFDSTREFPIAPVADTDEYWVRHALALARHAESLGEVPVGAVLARGDTLIAEAWNCPISTHDPSAHAEMLDWRCKTIVCSIPHCM